MTVLEVKELTVKYGELTVVDRLSFSVAEGQWLMITGPNGAGKSTVLNAMTGGAPYSGEILFDGGNIRRKKPGELARLMGILTQTHPAEYSFSVEEVVSLGRYCYSSGFLSGRGGDSEAVEQALELTGMARQRKQSILTLSGGELQRTFLAQVLAQDPQLMLLDEPSNHLDLVYQKQLFGIIKDWLKAPGRAVISVVHDLSLAKAYGTRALLMERGKAAAFGDTGEVLKPENLDSVYQMDVGEWMRGMLSQWEE